MAQRLAAAFPTDFRSVPWALGDIPYMILGRLNEIYPTMESDQPVELPTGNSLWSVPLEPRFRGGTSDASHSLLERRHSLLVLPWLSVLVTSKEGVAVASSY